MTVPAQRRSRRRPRYLNPFEGRKKAIHLSGLFLFDPDVALRIQGQSVRTTFMEMGEESLFKGLERARRTGRATNLLKRRLIELLPPPIGNSLADAFDASDTQNHPFGRMGPWEAHLMGALCDDNGEPLRWPQSAHFLLEVERASRHPAALCNEGRFQAASEYLAEHPLLQRFMSPEVLNGLAHATNPNDQLALRAVVALELWLSLLALWDIEGRLGDTDDDRSYIMEVLRRDHSAGLNSVAQLFDWLLKAANVATAAALMDDPRLSEFSVQIGTLGSWSRGTNFPSASYSVVIARALLSVEDAATFKILIAAARQLNFLGFVAQELEKAWEPLSGTKAEQAKLLGLGFPFGHKTIESWIQGRYPVWLQFHRANIRGHVAAER